MSTNPRTLPQPHRQTRWRRAGLPETRQAALDAAQALMLQIDNSPYWTDPENQEQLRDLYRLVDKIRKSAAPTPDGAIRAVMGAIKLRCCETMEEIVEETNLPSLQVRDIVAELVAEGAATRIDRFPQRPGRHRDYIYKLTGKPFRDWVV